MTSLHVHGLASCSTHARRPWCCSTSRPPKEPLDNAASRSATHYAASTSQSIASLGVCSRRQASCTARRRVVSRALFDPPPFQPEKLAVLLAAGTTSLEPAPPRSRKYTLTHNDITGNLRLTIGPDYNEQQISGFYTRLLRDEVVAEWINIGTSGYALHVYCHVSGEERWLAPPLLRNYIFRREMPLVLDTLVFADRQLLRAQPELAQAQVYVHFQSSVRELDTVEYWGLLGDRATWPKGPTSILLRMIYAVVGWPPSLPPLPADLSIDLPAELLDVEEAVRQQQEQQREHKAVLLRQQQQDLQEHEQQQELQLQRKGEDGDGHGDGQDDTSQEVREKARQVPEFAAAAAARAPGGSEAGAAASGQNGSGSQSRHRNLGTQTGTYATAVHENGPIAAGAVTTTAAGGEEGALALAQSRGGSAAPRNGVVASSLRPGDAESGDNANLPLRTSTTKPINGAVALDRTRAGTQAFSTVSAQSAAAGLPTLPSPPGRRLSRREIPAGAGAAAAPCSGAGEAGRPCSGGPDCTCEGAPGPDAVSAGAVMVVGTEAGGRFVAAATTPLPVLRRPDWERSGGVGGGAAGGEVNADRERGLELAVARTAVRSSPLS